MLLLKCLPNLKITVNDVAFCFLENKEKNSFSFELSDVFVHITSNLFVISLCSVLP